MLSVIILIELSALMTSDTDILFFYADILFTIYHTISCGYSFKLGLKEKIYGFKRNLKKKNHCFYDRLLQSKSGLKYIKY